jgi:hypothetical protein
MQNPWALDQEMPMQGMPMQGMPMHRALKQTELAIAADLRVRHTAPLLDQLRSPTLHSPTLRSQ